MKKVKVLVADDHAVVRKGITHILKSKDNIEIVGEAENGLEAVAKCGELHPDVLLLDIAMPKLSGLEAIKLVRQESPDVAVIILSMYSMDDYIQEVLKSGALGYVLKSSLPTEIYDAVLAASKGKYYISEDIRDKVVSGYLSQSSDDIRVNRFDTLTPQEKRVFLMLVEGSTIKEIAKQLSVTPKAIEKHRTLISKKLNLKTRIEMVHYAIRNEIISLR